MPGLDQEFSTLTDRYQTTIPASIRRALNLTKGDRIRYSLDASGRVYIEPIPADGSDTALGPFLDLLAADIRARPTALVSVGPALVAQMQALVEGVDIDLDTALDPQND